jgi:hypothetical protein
VVRPKSVTSVNLTGLPKKIIKSPKAKRAKGKKYRKEGYRTGA